MKEFDARFFDGETAVAHRVRVQHDADALVIRDADGRELARWPIEGLRTVGDPGEDGAALLTCSGWSQARLVVDDEDVRIDLAAMVPRLKRLGRRRRTGAFSWAGLAIGAAAVIAALIGAVDRLPGWAAPLVPQSWQRPVGDQVIASLAAGHGFCDAAPGTTALNRLAARLVSAAGLSTPVSVRVIDRRDVNAFAVPGQQVGVFRGLIDEADDADEIAGVLAHEVGHIVHRHPVEGVLRQLGFSAVVRLLLGGAPSGVEDTAAFGQMLVTLRYSRAAETQADGTALELLDRAGIDGRGLNRFLARLQGQGGSGNGVPALLLTHPPTAERLAATAKAAAGGPALSPEDWQALRHICDHHADQ